ncbi:MAG TPA: helix-turn-helix transcriptional regulator [Candidatus Paceibacterota bacterium]
MLALQITDTELEECFSSLTARQAEIFRDVAAGYTNQAIAERHGILEGTVKQHVSSIYRTLKVGHRPRGRFNRAIAISLLQRHDAFQKGWRENIRVQESVANRCPEQGISVDDLVDLVLACFQKNVQELTFRFRSLNLKALKMKDEGGREQILIVDRD